MLYEVVPELFEEEIGRLEKSEQEKILAKRPVLESVSFEIYFWWVNYEMKYILFRKREVF